MFGKMVQTGSEADEKKKTYNPSDESPVGDGGDGVATKMKMMMVMMMMLQ